MSHTDNLKRLISEHRRHLQKLKEQEVKFGLHTPTYILTEIEDRTQEIERLEVELNETRNWEKPTLSGLGGINQPNSSRSLRVFLCHSSEDKQFARDLYHRLKSEGFDPWLDEEKLLPGREWKLEIPKAVRSADLVIICLSRASVTKTGYVNKEIRYALDIADEQPEGAIFLVPLKLEECQVPDRLSRWHWVNYFEDRGYEKLKRALDAREIELGLTSKRHTVQTCASSKEEDVIVIKNLYPLSFSDLVTELRNRYPDFRVNKRFFEIKRELEKSEKYCKARYFNEFDKRGLHQKFYSNEILEEFDKYQREIEVSVQINVTEQRVTENQILIIDDDADIRKLLTLYLSREFPALSLIEARDATEAVEQLSIQKPCIVILDAFLAEPESYDVLEVLNYQDEGVLIIFLTLSASVSKLDIISNYEHIHSGQIEILQKPFAVEDLGNMIHHLLSPDKSEND